jgi:hypothetical protein
MLAKVTHSGTPGEDLKSAFEASSSRTPLSVVCASARGDSVSIAVAENAAAALKNVVVRMK